MQITELIANAPWREAKNYRHTWPHEYVLLQRDRQRELFAAVCARICAGEGLVGRFFGSTPTYQFVADYKYWFMTPCAQIDLDNPGDEFVLNRVLLYRDRRDFIIQAGDTGRREDYPSSPPHTRH